MNSDNNRSDAINKLTAFCDTLNLGYSYTEKEFTITLPSVEPVPVVPIATSKPHSGRKTFNTDTWGETGINEEDLPDDFQMPDMGSSLEEGIPPEEDREP